MAETRRVEIARRIRRQMFPPPLRHGVVAVGSTQRPREYGRRPVPSIGHPSEAGSVYDGKPPTQASQKRRSAAPRLDGTDSMGPSDRVSKKPIGARAEPCPHDRIPGVGRYAHPGENVRLLPRRSGPGARAFRCGPGRQMLGLGGVGPATRKFKSMSRSRDVHPNLEKIDAAREDGDRNTVHGVAPGEGAQTVGHPV